jgi:hypothetical protein
MSGLEALEHLISRYLISDLLSVFFQKKWRWACRQVINSVIHSFSKYLLSICSVKYGNMKASRKGIILHTMYFKNWLRESEEKLGILAHCCNPSHSGSHR